MVLLGIPFSGWVFDRTGSYDGAFLTFLSLYAASALILAFLRLPARATREPRSHWRSNRRPLPVRSARERAPDLLEHVA